MAGICAAGAFFSWLEHSLEEKHHTPLHLEISWSVVDLAVVSCSKLQDHLIFVWTSSVSWPSENAAIPDAGNSCSTESFYAISICFFLSILRSLLFWRSPRSFLYSQGIESAWKCLGILMHVLRVLAFVFGCSQLRVPLEVCHQWIRHVELGYVDAIIPFVVVLVGPYPVFFLFNVVFSKYTCFPYKILSPEVLKARLTSYLNTISRLVQWIAQHLHLKCPHYFCGFFFFFWPPRVAN